MLESRLLKLVLIFISFLLSTCAPKQGPRLFSQDQVAQLTYLPVTKVHSASEIRGKLARFKKLLGQGKPFSNEFWQLHDDLFKIYASLKATLPSNVVVPPRSQKRISFKSFCLHSSRASPSELETFRWQKKAVVPYQRKILEYGLNHPKVKQSDLQTLLWNLGNKTYREEYPDDLLSLLRKIDPKAVKKLPSETKSEAIGFFKDLVRDNVPVVSEAEDVVDLIQGKFYDYQEIAERIERLTSTQPLVSPGSIRPFADTPLYTRTKSDGYSTQTIDFFNPTNEPVTIDPLGYTLVPDRSDVQSIGIYPDTLSDKERETLQQELEQTLYEEMFRLGIGFTPIVGDVADLYELLTGNDFVSGKQLSANDRILSGLGLIAGSGAAFRNASRYVYAPSKYKGTFEQSFVQQSGRRLEGNVDFQDARRVIDVTDYTVDGVRKSPTLNRIYSDPGFQKTDFYVRKDGSVIPATGYRYVGSKNPYVSETIESGQLPAVDEPHYITFDRFDSASDAQSRLQLRPDRNDASYRLEFDTLQTADDLRVPRGRFGSRDYLEPLTGTFPEYGAGGATQAITNNKIHVREIVDLRSGEVLFPKGGR